MTMTIIVFAAEIRAEGDTAVQAREDESAEEALQRRLKESARVEERVVQIYTADDFQKQLEEVQKQVTEFAGIAPFQT